MDESDLVEFEYNELYFTVDEYINTIPSPFGKYRSPFNKRKPK